MTRSQRPHRAAFLLCAALLSLGSFAQQTRYWVGGDGEWSDAQHWSTAANGPGGAGAPHANDRAVIAGPARVHVDVNAQCAGLSVDGRTGEVAITGDGERMRLHGGFALQGAVRWSLSGTIELDGDAHAVNTLDLRGIPLASDVRLTGGTWSMQSDLVLMEARMLLLAGGSLSTNGSLLRAGALRTEGHQAKRLIAGTSVVMLDGPPETGGDAFVEPGSSRLLVGGEVRDWGAATATARDADRNINICGTSAGQTLFTINAQLISNYNGFGVSCHGVCNGRVQVTVTGGVGPFTYSWIGGPTTATWNNVCPGNQIVIVTDQGQGVSCATTVQVTDPALLSVIFFGNQPPTCSTVCNGSSNALAVGGVPGYTYNWNNGAGTGSSFNQLCPGPNTLHVTDANNCAFDTTFNFPIQPISPHLTVTNASCAGSCNGSATAAPTGGTGSYSYNWQPPPGTGQGTASAGGLCPGAYTLRVSDVNGCDTTVQFQITAPPPIVPNATHVNATCFDRCDGRATVAPTGAAGPFTYLWTPAPGAGQGTANATAMCAGSYTVNIRDNATNCDTTVTIVITAPPAIIPNPLHTDLTCANECNGTASVSPSGGTPGYSYLWTPVPPVGQGTPDILQLCAGTWTVRVVDIVGCDTTVQIVVQQPPPLDPHGTFTDITCAGQCNGTASVAPTGGTGAYTYQWVPNPPAGQGTANASQLCPGNWSVTVRDAVGCDTTITFSLLAPPPLQVTPMQTNVTCGSNCDGTASATVTGGTPPYTYNWSPAPPSGQGTPSASGLCAGTWTLTITDANGCMQVQAFNILPAVVMQLSLQVIPATCPNVCDGRAGVIVTGGSGSYAYAWSPAPGAGQGTANVTGLCPQAYSLTVTDGVGCDTTISFTVNAPLPIVSNGTVDDVSCHGTCDGSITLLPVGGSGSYTYMWTPVPPNGQGTAHATGLCAGSYQVTITSGACDTTLTFQVQEPPALDAAVTVTPTTCAGDCDGSASASVSGGTPGYTYLWTPAPPGGQGTPNATGLCVGSYTLTVTDAAGCDTTLTIAITAPPPIQPNLTTTSASCGGGCDGTATVAPTGGSGVFDIQWSPPPGGGQGTPNATGLCVGVYAVTLTDAAGCDTTLQFTISTPSSIVVVPTATDASCLNSCDGTIGLATSGGVPPYTYSWSPTPGGGQGTPNATGLCPGDWTVTVGDAAGCDTVLVISIGAPTPITPNGSFTNETCNGPCDGTATVSPSGGSGTYAFNWSPAPGTGQGTNTVTGLCAGNWGVTITDAAGCDTTWSFTVLPVVPITATFDTHPVPCAGTCSGSSTITASGGAGGFTYQWTPAPGGGQGTATATGLCLGVYSVLVTDAVGCTATFTTTVTAPPPIQVVVDVTDEECTAPCTGTATATVTGGGGGYVFDWQPAPGGGQGTANVTGLCANVLYTLSITDANGCDTTIILTVRPFQEILANAVTAQTTCAGRCDGSIELAPSGGTGPYTITWTPVPGNGQGSLLATDLCSGSYDALITDAAGCDSLYTFVIDDPTPVTAIAVVQDLRCNGQCNGDINVTVSGGSGAFNFTWSPVPPSGQGTPHITGLCAGDWHLTIGGPNGCDTAITWTVHEPPPLATTADISPSHCTVCDGSVFVHATGGTPGYTFAWGPPLNSTTTDSLLTDLCAGVYPLTVTDAAGCTASFAYAVADPDAEQLTMTDGTTSCPGRCDGQVAVAFNCSVPTCTIAWFDGAGTDLAQSGNDLSGLCAGLYLAQVTNGAGCVAIDTATVTAPPAITTGISSTPVTCGGDCDGTATVGITGGTGPFTLTWTPAPGAGQGTPNASAMCPGPYDIHIADAIGCDTTYSVLILAPSPTVALGTVTDISCAGQCDGAIHVDVAGGTGAFTYQWTPTPPSGQGTSTISALCAGTYDVLLRDANGCDTTLTFTLADPPPIVLSASSTPSQCQVCNGSASVTVTGGTGPVDVTWTDATGTVVGSGTSLSGLCAGVYTAHAQDDHGCTVTAVVAITDLNGEALTMIDGRTLCATACDAQVGVTFACTTGPCSITWYDAGANVIAQNAFTVTDLCPGIYIAEVSNGAGCTTIDTATVTPSNAILPNLSTTPARCAGACDGTATVGPVGGVGPYTYDWTPDPPTGDGTPHVTGLCPGVYDVHIADATGCDTTVSVLILGPPPLQVSAQVGMVTCNAACDGSIVVTPTGGNGFFSFTWSPVPPSGQGSNGAFDLCAGDWTVTVADVNGCDTTITYSITEPSPLALAFNSTESTCSVCTGTASVQPSGGTAPYTYTWTQDGSIFATDSALTDLCAALYGVTVTDVNGCSAQLQVPVNDADGEVVTTTGDVVTCPGTCDGEVSAAFNCAVPTCTVSWFDASGTDLNQSGTSVQDLCAGTYFVRVTNGDGCITQQPAVVTEPGPIVANLSTTQVTCAGACDGTATVGPTGGAGGYVFDWEPDPPNGDGGPQATGLCAGNYEVTITDAAGCSILQGVIILAPAPITAVAVVGPITCNGACDGSITVDAQGGNGGFLYQWSPEPGAGQGTNTVSQLCAGDWTLTIVDVNGCDTTFTVPVTDPPVLVTDLATTNNACFGDCSGTGHIDVSGGAGPYDIAWLNAAGDTIAQDVPDVGSLCSGDYSVTVTDANRCVRTLPFTIGQGVAIDAALLFTNVTCNGPCDGTASINPTGGSGVYTITWSPEPATGQGTNTVTGLCAGNVQVTIADAAGCDTTVSFTVLPFQPIVPNGTVQNVTCNAACNGSIMVAPTGGNAPYTYAWSPEPPAGQGTNTASSLCPGDYTLIITDLTGCDTTVTFTVTEPPALVVTTDAVTDASCNTATDGSITISIGGGTPGYGIAWSGPGGFASTDEDITGLLPGAYEVTVTDANACTITQQVTVGALNSVMADAGLDANACAAVPVTLDGSNSQGATAYRWTDEDGNVVGTDAVVQLTGLSSGVHTFTLTASDGPCSATDEVLVTVFTSPTADAGADQSLFVQGSVTLGGQPSGPSGSTFSWAPDSLLDHADAANPVATVDRTTWFVLTVVSSDGCTGIDSVLITVVPEVRVPSGFTPNGDGHNDVWQLDFIELFPDCTVEIFNRWGEPLFKSVGYRTPWDGKYKDGFVPVGTYYYAIDLHDPRFPEALTGPLTVIR